MKMTIRYIISQSVSNLENLCHQYLKQFLDEHGEFRFPDPMEKSFGPHDEMQYIITLGDGDQREYKLITNARDYDLFDSAQVPLTDLEWMLDQIELGHGKGK